MKARMLHSGEPRVWAVVFDKGDEVISGLEGFAARERLAAGQITAIGAFSRVTLGYFEADVREYHRTRLDEQVEVVSLLGDLATVDGRPALHAHVVVSRKDTTAYGGHLLEGHVWPTLEVVVTVPPAYLRRRMDEETKLALIEI